MASTTADLVESEVSITGAPLRRLADIERQMRQAKLRYEAEIANLENEHALIVETAFDLGHVEEVYPYGTYRLVERVTAGRRSLDEAAFKQLFPDLCETVTKVPTIAKAEKALSAASFALVVKAGEPKVSRELTFEAAPLEFAEECEP